MTHPFPSFPASSPFLNPTPVSQSLKNCLSKLGCGFPASYPSRGQYLDESGVRTSSIKISWGKDESVGGTSPNSNLVSARIRPWERAYDEASLKRVIAMVEIWLYKDSPISSFAVRVPSNKHTRMVK
jgi:hypothetical protein